MEIKKNWQERLKDKSFHAYKYEHTLEEGNEYVYQGTAIGY